MGGWPPDVGQRLQKAVRRLIIAGTPQSTLTRVLATCGPKARPGSFRRIANVCTPKACAIESQKWMSEVLRRTVSTMRRERQRYWAQLLATMHDPQCLRAPEAPKVQQDQSHTSAQVINPPPAVEPPMRSNGTARGGRLRGGQDHSTGSRGDGRHEEAEERCMEVCCSE